MFFGTEEQNEKENDFLENKIKTEIKQITNDRMSFWWQIFTFIPCFFFYCILKAA